MLPQPALKPSHRTLLRLLCLPKLLEPSSRPRLFLAPPSRASTQRGVSRFTCSTLSKQLTSSKAHTETQTSTITSAYTSTTTEYQAPSTVYKTTTQPAQTIVSTQTLPGTTYTSVETAPGKSSPHYVAKQGEANLEAAYTETETSTITSAYTATTTEVQAPSTVYKTTTLPAPPAQTVYKTSTLPGTTYTSVETAPGKS